MNIKLAHKWDSPATLGCTVESVKFEPSNVYFEAKWYCPFWPSDLQPFLEDEVRIESDADEANQS